MTHELKKCPVCGKEFDISYYVNYVYKKSMNGRTIHYCGYNCMRVVEREQEELERSKLKDEYKQYSI